MSWQRPCYSLFRRRETRLGVAFRRIGDLQRQHEREQECVHAVILAEDRLEGVGQFRKPEAESEAERLGRNGPLT